MIEAQTMRVVFVMLSAVLLATSAVAVDNASSEAAIKNALLKAKSWTLFIEYTETGAPSDRAQKLVWEYFERDGKLMARQLGLAFGGCDTEVFLRNDGLSFRWCPPYNGEPSLDFDPTDPKYPFKSRDPRKLWLQSND
jgi:hypothetical protein